MPDQTTATEGTIPSPADDPVRAKELQAIYEQLNPQVFACFRNNRLSPIEGLTMAINLLNDTAISIGVPKEILKRMFEAIMDKSYAVHAEAFATAQAEMEALANETPTP